MKNRNTKVLFLLLFLVIFSFIVSACDDKATKVEDLRLEEQFDFSLPEDGNVQYRSFVNVGFDFRDYSVITYEDTQTIERLNWLELSDKDIYRFKGAVLEHNNRLAMDDCEPIPEEFLPDYGSVRKIFLVSQGEIDNMTALLLFDAEKASIYICIVKT